MTTTVVPLTTVFTPAESCSNVLYTFSTQYHGLSWFKQDVLGPGNGPNSACYPPRWSIPLVIYSPGVCPSGYLAVSEHNNGNLDGPTTATCCPSHLTYALQRGCESTILAPTITTLVVNATETIITKTTFVAAAYPITVAWASSDLNLFTPKAAPLGLHSVSSTARKQHPLGSHSTSSTGSATKHRSTSSTKPTSTETRSSLSTGAIAGISVAVIVVFLVALTVGLWLFFSRKRRSGNAARGTQSDPEVYISAQRITHKKHEISELGSAQADNVREIQVSSPGSE